jgi:hypothetical protein
MEINCIEPSLSVRFPWFVIYMSIFANGSSNEEKVVILRNSFFKLETSLV